MAVETEKSEYWVWRDPDSPRYLGIELYSDFERSSNSDAVWRWCWCRSPTSRNLRHATSEDNARLRLHQLRAQWQRALVCARDELDQDHQRWRKALDRFVQLPPASTPYHPPRSREDVDNQFEHRVQACQSHINSLERLLAITPTLQRVCVERTTKIEIEPA